MTMQANLAFLESQAAYIEAEARMIKYGSIQYSDLVGVSMEANPNADSIVYYSYDGAGGMEFMANGASDYPYLNTEQAQHTVRIEWAGLAYGWTDREIDRAMLANQDLSDRLVRLAFRKAEEMKDNVFINGRADFGWDGFVNLPTTGNAAVQTGAAGTEWDTATDEAIFKNINDGLSNVWDETNQVRIPDTITLPPKAFARLQQPMGNDASRSIMNYVMENNILTASTGQRIMFRTLRQLEGIASGDTGRMILYPRDMEVLRLHVPQELMFIEPQRGPGARWTYYGHLVLGGLEVMEPSAIVYVDGI